MLWGGGGRRLKFASKVYWDNRLVMNDLEQVVAEWLGRRIYLASSQDLLAVIILLIMI